MKNNKLFSVKITGNETVKQLYFKLLGFKSGKFESIFVKK